MNDYALYILMRNDLNSLNPGKAMAQAAHAANKAQEKCYFTNSDKLYSMWKVWAGSLGFGKTIVLSVEKEDIEDLEHIYNTRIDFGNNDIIYGTIIDPTYPIKDGVDTHYVEAITCSYVFGDSNNPNVQDLIAYKELYS